MRSARIFETRFGELVEPKVKNSRVPDSDTKFENVPEISYSLSASEPVSEFDYRAMLSSRIWTQVSAELTNSIDEE